ncbi:MAG: PAS domain S-box protein [Rhodocyclaceae bacterium]|nr:PAS domain S-box protein [Rhodocyclaceae bacterium]
MDQMLPMMPNNSRRMGWLLALPKVGIVLLLIALLTFLWLLNRNEAEQERAALIKDVLWLEQNLRFNLSRNEEQLQQLAADLSNRPDPEKIFRLRAAHQLKNNSEISQIIWFDKNRKVVDALPTTRPPDDEIEAFGPLVTEKAFELASRLGKVIYSQPFFLEGNQAFIEVMVPIFAERQLIGMLAAVYPLDQFLAKLVPWWFTEKYRVIITDDNDIQYATKSNIEGDRNQSYEVPFDPPGYGMTLRITNYKDTDNSLQRLLTLVIIMIAAATLWSLWLVRDLIKKRSQAEEALRAEHAFRTAMENSLTVGMRARDLDGRIIYVNPAFCKMTGFQSIDLVGKTPPMPYWVPEQIDETYALHAAVLAGKAPRDGFEITFQRHNGERFNALIYEARLIDGKGQHTGWMASVLDVTERKRAEELARQQQEQLQFTARLVTLGEMASTLAHELNQPLSAIASYNAGCLNLLESPNGQTQDIRPALEKISIQAQRAGKIIRRVHDFVRKSEPKRAPCSFAEVLEDCLGFTEADARKQRIRIACEIPPLPLIPADRLMLEQVLLNLIRNGMEAMANIAVADRLLCISIALGKSEMRVSVSDQGCGISPDIQGKLFTAFFTTKPEGMGVGLSICRSIIEFHRGRLWVEENPRSTSGSGTIFVFTLPLETE